MQTEDQILYVTVEKAAEMLNKSPHSVRQLVARGKLEKHTLGHNIFVDLKAIELYYATKKGIKSWEENYSTIKEKSFVSLENAALTLMVQTAYLLRLIKQGSLEGYVTISGDIMIAKDSINTHLRTQDNDASDI
jgi:hypothetical protein